MQRRATLTLALAAAAAASGLTAPAAEPVCVAETYTTVCRNGHRELRIIRNTVSPSGHYGVAWQVPDDGSAEEWERNGEKDGSKLAGPYDGSGKARNFLLRLPDGKPIRKLGGDHMGDIPFTITANSTSLGRRTSALWQSSINSNGPPMCLTST